MELRQITPKRLQKWHDQRDIDKLVAALKVGSFQHRMEILKLLAALRAHEAKPAIAACLDDAVQSVSELAMETLESLGTDQATRALIDAKRAAWAEKTQREEAHRSENWKADSPEEEQAKLVQRARESSLRRAEVTGRKMQRNNQRMYAIAAAIAAAIWALFYFFELIF
ncbi:MAG: hypothetical protein AAGB22_10510 [Bacteroidota bacterium]